MGVPTKKLATDQKNSRDEKEKLFAAISDGTISIGEATKMMRKIVGLTQKGYAEKILKIYPRVLIDIENGRGNPTLETLKKIARPFGLTVGFVREKKK